MGWPKGSRRLGVRVEVKVPHRVGVGCFPEYWPRELRGTDVRLMMECGLKVCESQSLVGPKHSLIRTVGIGNGWIRRWVYLQRPGSG